MIFSSIKRWKERKEYSVKVQNLEDMNNTNDWEYYHYIWNIFLILIRLYDEFVKCCNK